MSGRRATYNHDAASGLQGWAFPIGLQTCTPMQRLPSSAPTMPFTHPSSDDEYQCDVDDAGVAVWEIELPFSQTTSGAPASGGGRVQLRMSTPSTDASIAQHQRRSVSSVGAPVESNASNTNNGSLSASFCPPSSAGSKRRRVTWRVFNALGQSVMENEAILDLPEFETLDDSLTSTRDRALVSSIAAALEADAMQQTTADLTGGGSSDAAGVNSAFERHLADLVAQSYLAEEPVPLLLSSDPLQLARAMRARNQMRKLEFSNNRGQHRQQATSNPLSADVCEKLRRSSALSVESSSSTTASMRSTPHQKALPNNGSAFAEGSATDHSTQEANSDQPSLPAMPSDIEASGVPSEPSPVDVKRTTCALKQEETAPIASHPTTPTTTTPTNLDGSQLCSLLIRYFGDAPTSER